MLTFLPADSHSGSVLCCCSRSRQEEALHQTGLGVGWFSGVRGSGEGANDDGVPLLRGPGQCVEPPCPESYLEQPSCYSWEHAPSHLPAVLLHTALKAGLRSLAGCGDRERRLGVDYVFSTCSTRQAAHPRLIQQETDQRSRRQRVKANMSASITAGLDLRLSLCLGQR